MNLEMRFLSKLKFSMKFNIGSFILLSAFFIATNSFSQDRAEYNKKFTEGSFLMLEENYPMALRNFLSAYQIDSIGANINYKIGFCYLKLPTERYKAERYLEKAVLNTSRAHDDIEPTEKTAPVEAYLYLAQAQHLSNKFDEAIANLQKYKSYIPPKKADKIKYYDHLIEISSNAKQFVANPSKVLITNLGDTVNSQYPDYSPVISADESVLAFTSRRETSTGGLRTVSNEYFEDIFISHKKEDGTWSTPVGIDENVNTNGNEATINLTADGQQLLIYRDDNGDGNIYISDLEGDRWSIPTKLGSDINSQYWETHACISADGNSLYYVSDRPGGYGGRDIYKCVKLPNGNWSLSRNLGPIINTPYDEDGVFIHPDQVTLFFSSQGHNSMGGFDIFYSSTQEGKWTEPVNIGYPTNTTDDDVFYVVSTDGKRAYYSSVKANGHGEKDIYMISLEGGARVQPIALLVGKIIVPEGEVLSNDNEINVTDVETGQIGIYKANTKTGKYILSLSPGKTYELSYRVDDNEFYHETLTVPMGTDYQEIEREVSLKPVILTTEGNTTKKEKPAEETKEKKTKKSEATESSEKQPLAKESASAIKKSSVSSSGEGSLDAVDDEITTNVNKSVTGTTLDNDKYPSDWDIKVYRGAISGPKHGWVSVKNNGEYTYTPNKGYAGKDSFTYMLYLHGKWNKYRDTATVSIDVVQNENAYYDIYFKYNVCEIDVKSDRFSSFINDLKSQIDSKGSIALTLESSASHVPTRKFKTNENLAESRAKEAKEKVINALKAKGIDESKITFNQKTLVQGPEYNQDYDTNKAVYQTYQYIRIFTAK